MIHVDADWQVHIDKDGTDFHYGDQKIGLDAHVKAIITGRAILLKQNLELPFRIEKRLGASCHLGDIRFDENTNSVVGTVQNPEVNLGQNAIFKLLNDAIGKLLNQQTEKFNQVPIIKKDQLEEIVSPAGGALKMGVGIEDVRIDVCDNDLSLKVKFGFKQKQLTN